MKRATDKQKKQVFVIMPFSRVYSRNQLDLTEFFQTNLKDRIESESSLRCRYIVARSGDTMDINAQIIRDVYSADVLLCDLSGPDANPNVMYELGMRLGLSNKPVILFREEHPDNKPIFDIDGFFIFKYRPNQYRLLEDHIIGKLKKYETGAEAYESPVFRILKTEPNILREVLRRRVSTLLDSGRNQVLGIQRAFGGALSDYLASKKIRKSGTTADETLEFVHKNKVKLAKLDWRQFIFHPNALPAINAFLTDLPLSELLDEDLAKRVNTLVHEYHQYFLSTDYVWQGPTFAVVLTFVTESYLLRQVLAGCQILVNLPSGKKADEVRKEVAKALDASALLK